MSVTQTLEFDYVAGQTLVAKLFPLSGDAADLQVGGDVACVEAANRDGLYQAAFTDVPAGSYKLRVYLGGMFVGSWIYSLTLTTATFREALLDQPALAGPYIRTITIQDSADDAPIENAAVRLFRSGETETLLTDVDGGAEFTVEAATWSYAIAATGYVGANGTIVVSDDGADVIQLTASAVTPPASPSLSAIEVLCLDSAGQMEAGVDVDIRMVTIPSGSQNIAFKGAKQTATSGVDGIARFEVVQGSTCEWKRGAADVWQRVSVDADGVTNVTSVIGSP